MARLRVLLTEAITKGAPLYEALVQKILAFKHFKPISFRNKLDSNEKFAQIRKRP
jgi:hypothetical protein